MALDHQLHRRTFLSASLAATALGAAACGFGGGSSDSDDDGGAGNNQPTGGGQSSGGQSSVGAPSAKDLTDTFREAHRPVNHLNPAFGGGGSPQSTLMLAMLREPLIRHNLTDTTKFEPGAAEKWEASEDGKTFTFHLRQDLKWSTGEPLTAQDFLWSCQYYYSPDLSKQDSQYSPTYNASPTSNFIVGLVDYYSGKTKDFSTVGIKAPDDHTIVITLTQPDYNFMTSMVRPGILPLQQKNVEANPKDFWLPEHFVGNGPYKLTQYKQNGTATLELNEHYWDAANFGIKKRTIQFNSGGPTAMMVSYNANEIDLFRVDGDPAALISGRNDIADQLKHGAYTQYKWVQVLPNKNPVLQENAKLRQAMAMALDRDALAKVSPPDTPAPSWVPSGITGYDKLPKIPYDVKQAKQLLEEAGFPGGKGLPKMTIITYEKMPVLEAVASMWKQNLGITTSVGVYEVGVYTDMLYGNMPDDFVGFGFNYHSSSPVSMMNYGAKYNDWDYYVPFAVRKQLYELNHGKDKDKYTASQRTEKTREIILANMIPAYKPYYDLVTKVLENQADPDKATELATQAATAYQESYLIIPLLWAGYTFMVKPRVHNITLTSYPYEMYTMKGVTLDPVKK
jgi:ABC-type transport system substrate-binding protein